MTQKTILLADLPPFLRNILEKALSGKPDVAVVSRSAQGDLIGAALGARADAVVTSHRDPAKLQAIDSRLARAANFSIVALTPDGRTAYIHRIHADTRQLDDATPQEIAARLLSG